MSIATHAATVRLGFVLKDADQPEPMPHESFARQIVGAATEQLPTGASIAPQLPQAGDETTVCDFAPKWHAASQRLLGLGHTVWYRDNRVMLVRPRGIAYAVYDAPATY